MFPQVLEQLERVIEYDSASIILLEYGELKLADFGLSLKV